MTRVPQVLTCKSSPHIPLGLYFNSFARSLAKISTRRRRGLSPTFLRETIHKENCMTFLASHFGWKKASMFRMHSGWNVCASYADCEDMDLDEKPAWADCALVSGSEPSSKTLCNMSHRCLISRDMTCTEHQVFFWDIFVAMSLQLQSVAKTIPLVQGIPAGRSPSAIGS